MKTLKKILIGVFIFIVAVIALALVLTKGTADVASAELAAIRKADYATAYGLTSKNYQSGLSLEAFKAAVMATVPLRDNVSETFSSRETKNDTGTVEGELTAKDGTKTPVTFSLVKENGDWKIDLISLLKTVATPPTPAAAPSAQAPSGDQSAIFGILVSDVADGDGYVTTAKPALNATLPKIYATAQITSTSEDLGITALLTYQANNAVVGPISGTITKVGNIMKAFSFTNTAATWPTGNYEVTVTLANGQTKTTTFSVE